MYAEKLRRILDEVADAHRARPIPDPEWKRIISSKFAQSVKTKSRLSFATANPDHCDGKEWLFDFATIELEQGIATWELSTAPTLLIAGEIELNPRTSFILNDFRKLIVSEGLFCFFIFQADNETVATRMFDRLIEGARGKQLRAMERGMHHPPEYLLSCFVYGTSRTFVHNEVKAPPLRAE